MRDARAARVRHLLAGVAIVAAAALAVALADRHAPLVDLTRGARHSLHPASVEVLALLPGPVEAVAFVPANPALRAGLTEFFARYRRHKDDFVLRFVDPREDLAQARAAGANLGEIVLAWNGRRERVNALGESEVTSALARLVRGADRFVAFLANNGERRPARGANHDVSRFAERLAERGFAVRELALGATGAIPDNAAVLVLASPTIAYLPSELGAIADYLARGGNVLWLAEPDAPDALHALGTLLGVAPLPGTIVDPVGLTKLRNPAYAVVLEFADHALLKGFNQTVALPYAAALRALKGTAWSAVALARTGAEAWTELGAMEGNVGFDGGEEVQGPLTLALALTRPAPDGSGTQRVVAIGDGDFLSNTFVENLGNLEFGRRALEWLAADDALIDVAVPEVPDRHLDLSFWQRGAILAVFGIALPVAFGLNAALLWWRRRRA